MSECWAAALGDCAGKISREHIVTRAINLDNEINVSGLDWCKEPKKVGLASLTAKVLCVAHNSALSELDGEAVRFAEAMRESFRLLTVRVGLKNRRWRRKKFPVDGPRLERWLLKTLINVTSGRDCPIGLDAKDPGLPSKSLVEIAFGKRTFQGEAGLYDLYDPPENRPRMDGIEIHTINTTANRVLGALFYFLGFRLLLFLDPKGPPLPLMEIATATRELAEVIRPSYHPTGIAYDAGRGLSHSVDFKWPRAAT
jgi:hypothetical protein